MAVVNAKRYTEQKQELTTTWQVGRQTPVRSRKRTEPKWKNSGRKG